MTVGGNKRKTISNTTHRTTRIIQSLVGQTDGRTSVGRSLSITAGLKLASG